MRTSNNTITQYKLPDVTYFSNTFQLQLNRMSRFAQEIKQKQLFNITFDQKQIFLKQKTLRR